MLTQITAYTSYWGYVLPSLQLMSIGMAGVFITASSTSLVGIGSHDAGVASALLNTLYAGALADHLRESPRTANGNALVHGCHVAFLWGGAADRVVADGGVRDERQKGGRAGLIVLG